MNEPQLHNFEGRVARIVAPLIARRARKQSMREELLSHFHQAYEEEFARLGDESLATQATLHRLGDADQLSSRLQASVPFFEMLMCLIFPRKELLMSRWFWILLGCLVALFGTAMVLPALAKMKHSGGLTTDVAEALAIGVAIVVAGLGLLAYGIRRLIRAS